MRILRTAAPILLAVLAYLFFATSGKMLFPGALSEPRGWDDPGAGYYAELAEGFRQGKLSMAIQPDPRLAQLENPYDYGQRDAAKIAYLWDASWYRGAYHLYFSPLPAVLFYLPYRLLTGSYPHDTLAAAFFTIWAFLAAAFFFIRTFPTQSVAWRIVWLLFIALANLIGFNLAAARIYEVAILAGMAFSAMWAYSLLRFDEKRSLLWACWTGLWLALAIVTRPNLAVLLLPTLLLLRRSFLPALIPVALVFSANALYNYARFGNPLETGITYQLNYIAMQGQPRCSIRNCAEISRFVNNSLQYTFLPPHIAAKPPHVTAPQAWMDRSTSWPGDFEELIGVIPLAPLAALAPFVAALLWPTSRPAAATLLGAWLTLFGLATCWWLVSRYTLDFALLMTLGTAVTIEQGLQRLRESGTRVTALRAAVFALAVYSIVLGGWLGVTGRNG
jgi:hypothetical protein